MKKIKPESLQALNLKLDIVRVLEEIGVADIADTHPEVLSSCPFHSGTAVEAVLTVDKKSRTAICDEAQCVVATGESLIDLYARATGRSIEDSAEYWAAEMEHPLEVELEPEPVAEAVPEIEPDLDDTEILSELTGGGGLSEELLPAAEVVEVAHDPSGEIDADDLAALATEAEPPDSVAPAEDPVVVSVVEAAPAPVAEPRPPRSDEMSAAQVAPQASPLATTKFQIPIESEPPSPATRADRTQDEEAVLRFLLGDDPSALHDMGAYGIADEDFRGGGSGIGGLSMHGLVGSAARRIRERRGAITQRAVLEGVPDAKRSGVAALLERIGRGTTTDRRRFRQALKRLSEAVLRENLESALRASLADLAAHTDDDAISLLRHAQERLQSVGESGVGPLVTQDVAMPEILQAVFDREQVPIPLFSDGLTKVLNGGLQFGHLVGFAGSSGSGKTALLLQMADGVAAANNARVAGGLAPIPVVFVSTTGARRHLTLRSLSRVTRMNAGAILSKRWISGWEGDFLESEIDINEDVESLSAYYERRVREAEAAYRDVEPYLSIIDAGPWISVDAIRAYVLQAMRRFGSTSAALFVDSLHHVTADPAGSVPAWNDAAQLAAVAARLKHLAVSMGVPVVGSVDWHAGADAKSPALGSLQSVQAVADVMFGLTVDEDILAAGGIKRMPELLSKRELAFKEVLERLREENPLEYSHSEYAVLTPLKHRSGPLNPVAFIFNKAWHSFEEMD